MAAVLNALAAYAPLIYILLALWAFLTLRKLWGHRRERNDSVFGLEKEFSQKRINQSIAVLVIIVILAVTELVFEAFLAPSMSASLLLGTPTVQSLTVPTNTLSPQMATRMAGTPLPTIPPGAVGCILGQIMITSPSPGQTISGQVDVIGTADIPNLGFYKYEVALQGTELWSTILAGRKAKNDEKLGAWDVTNLAPGDYLLRLVVTDNQGQALPTCTIPVRVTGE